jgi:hypothetical protein
MYVCQAEDTDVDGQPLSIEQKVTVAGMGLKKTGKLAERVEIAEGMRAMVITNISTESDLANGKRGVDHTGSSRTGDGDTRAEHRRAVASISVRARVVSR